MRYTKKPVTIEAWRNTPDAPRPTPAWLDDALAQKAVLPSPYIVGALDITTLEGVMRADVGDWIIRGVKGEMYPCRADIFAATYEPAEPGKDTP